MFKYIFHVMQSQNDQMDHKKKKEMEKVRKKEKVLGWREERWIE